MKKRLIALSLLLALLCGLLSGCGAKGEKQFEAGKKALYGLEGTEIDLETAYTEFTEAAEKGCTDANFYLGVLCEHYGYPERDSNKVLNYYLTAGENPYAQIEMGFIFLNGSEELEIELDWNKAEELFRKALDAGCSEAYLGLGRLAEYSYDYSQAAEYFTKALEGTEQLYVALAYKYLGSLYYLGLGVEQDFNKALEYLEKAAELGDASAYSSLGWIYSDGYAFEKDYTKALEYYRKGAELGDEDSAAGAERIEGLTKGAEHLEAGKKALYGLEGSKIDCETAFIELKKALDAGCTDANFYLGVLFLDQQANPKENALMSKEYNEAAVGNPYVKIQMARWHINFDEYTDNAIFYNEAADLCCTGVYYVLGREDDSGDYSKKIEYYNRATKCPEPLYVSLAYEKLGDLYFYGRGVEKDEQKALEYYDKAVEYGNTFGYLFPAGDYAMDEDYTKAEEFFKKAIERGSVNAMKRLGAYYEDCHIGDYAVEYGYSSPARDYKKAREYYAMAGDAGHIGAVLRLGIMNFYGKGSPINYAEAKKCFERVMESEDEFFEDEKNYAAGYLGNMYLHGKGVETDYAKAMEYLDLSTSEIKCLSMGDMYLYGLGTEADYPKAIEYYKDLIDYCYLDACPKLVYMYEKDLIDGDDGYVYYDLGYVFEQGLGVKPNKKKAIDCYEKAVELGCEYAEGLADKLRNQ